MSITVTDVSKSFGDFRALQDVSVEIPTGELVAILGPSGSGKTTLLRLIAGLETLDRGRGAISFHDEDVRDQPVRKRRVGFVFQHYALFRHMTVFQNVAFGLRCKPRRERPARAEIRRRVHELLSLVQLEGLAGRYPTQLSGGQRQRVALARALAVEPRVLLLDEPFGALDAKVRLELRKWIRRLHDELHITSVFVTHDQEEALEVADRIVIMNKGRIEQVGTAAEVYHRPATEFVMNFLGQVNTFHGRATGRDVEFASIRVGVTGAIPDGDVRVFVRPHDFELAPQRNGKPSFAARITRVHTAGAITRIEMTLPDGRVISAELPPDRFAELAASDGDTVYVTPRQVHVF
ncbi:MAG: sulfate/molybdate ABC transporter ATP-binding protein [Phycisphaeraceae bacterium]|nr:sulfate/molybdate ABC transporter ATP-binding protein [Phycisphaeraceae bacterium]